MKNSMDGFHSFLMVALAQVREGVVIVDPDGEILWMNPAAEQMTGRALSDVQGGGVDTLFQGGETPMSRSVRDTLEGGDVPERQHRFSLRDRPSKLAYTVAPVSEDGLGQGAVIVIRSCSRTSDPDAGKLSSRGEVPGVPDDHRPHRVLVMDDDEVIRSLTVQKLIRLGYESEGAVSGEEALQKYRSSRQAGIPFDLVVLDLVVRGGMGGKETVEMLRRIDPNVKAVLTSGHAADPVLTNYWEYGFCGVVRKPFVIKELDIAIRQVIDEIPAP